MATVPDWNCPKWADCGCSAGGTCGCGNACSCGSVSIESVTKAMEEGCPKTGCGCGPVCMCKRGECNSCGQHDKTPSQWVETVKAQTTAAAPAPTTDTTES